MNHLIRLASIGGIFAVLAGCQQGKAPEVVESQAAESISTAAPDAKPGLSLAAGRLVLPAVKGNPGAAYFSLTNASDKPAAIAAVDVAGAGMASIHETIQVDGHSTMRELKAPQAKPGQTLTFASGGKHVMVDGVPEGLKPGARVEITITFADGDKLSAPLVVVAPGGGS
jgi:copper(I)-binding protein